MFGIFKKKSQIEVLQDKYAKLMKEAHDLSKHNRTQSDQKYAEANLISEEIGKLK